MSGIANSLGIGSGIDTAALIADLSAAARAPKEARIVARETAHTAKISALAEAADGIDTFAASLNALIAGGSLFTQPTSSNEAVLAASALPGARLGGLSAQIEVMQIAKGQTLVSGDIAGRAAPVGQGNLTLATSKGSFAITIGAANDSLVGLARAINAAAAGVTAAIVEDAAGARLVLKGATGAAESFTLTPAVPDATGLSRFAYPADGAGAMDAIQAAQDATVKLDGVTVSRASNSFSDLIAGVQIDLKQAAPGSVVTLGAKRPTAEIRQAVTDFVAAYNELEAVLDKATAPAGSDGSAGGPLRSDLGIREMRRQLAKLSSTVLAGGGSVSSLAEIGVRTGRDGALSVDTAKLDAVLAADPDSVEALFNPSQRSDNPLVTIVSVVGKAKPGTYTLTNLLPGSGGTSTSGMIAGKPGFGYGATLSASFLSPAAGLVIQPLAAVASATITVDAGLGGALQAIRDALRAKGGPLAGTEAQIKAEGKAVARERETMEARADAYKAQLTKSFTAMDGRVAAYKATQSYLEQQIKMWTNSDD